MSLWSRGQRTRRGAAEVGHEELSLSLLSVHPIHSNPMGHCSGFPFIDVETQKQKVQVVTHGHMAS